MSEDCITKFNEAKFGSCTLSETLTRWLNTIFYLHKIVRSGTIVMLILLGAEGSGTNSEISRSNPLGGV
jgi:hypothetical protein